jgi:hypothetical protein
MNTGCCHPAKGILLLSLATPEGKEIFQTELIKGRISEVPILFFYQ